jgi:hypothetical protein
MSAIIEEFNDYRSKMNEKLADNNKNKWNEFSIFTMRMLQCTWWTKKNYSFSRLPFSYANKKPFETSHNG